MNYLSLYKASFKNNINYKELYNERFNMPNTIHFPIMINDNPSFLYLNEEVLSLIEDIQTLSDKVTRANPLIEEIIATNAIEGIVVNKEEVIDLLNTNQPKEYKRLYGLVNKYRDILLKDKEFVPITDSFKLREVYNDILIQDIEKSDQHNIPDGLIFRRDIVNIVSSTKTIHKGIYPESKVIEAVDSALKILNDNREEKRYVRQIRKRGTDLRRRAAYTAGFGSHPERNRAFNTPNKKYRTSYAAYERRDGYRHRGAYGNFDGARGRNRNYT